MSQYRTWSSLARTISIQKNNSEFVDLFRENLHHFTQTELPYLVTVCIYQTLLYYFLVYRDIKNNDNTPENVLHETLFKNDSKTHLTIPKKKEITSQPSASFSIQIQKPFE